MRDKGFTLSIAARLRELVDGLPVQLVFKASFDKANRTSADSYRGARSGGGGSEFWRRSETKRGCR